MIEVNSLKERLTPLLFEKRLQQQKSYNALKTANPRSSLFFPSYPLFKGVLKLTFKLLGLYKHCYTEASTPLVNQNTFYIKNLPSCFDNFILLHLSDLHLDTQPKLADTVIQIIEGLSYDAAVITGDFFEHTSRNTGLASANMKRLLKALQKPLYGVLGNHDYLELTPFLESNGIHVLLNETTFIKKRQQQIALCGIDDPHFYRTHDLEKTALAVPEKTPSILLAHSPEVFFDAEQFGFDVMLSGHSHGGQICLPGGIPILNNSRSPRHMISGYWHYKKLQGYTSRGVGSNVLPLRLFCPPEIVLHKLKTIPSDGQA